MKFVDIAMLHSPSLFRYFKDTWRASSCCGTAQWFQVRAACKKIVWTVLFDQMFQWHRLCMVTVWAATIAGVVLVAIELGGWPYDQVDCPNLMMMAGWWQL